jgi:hypothetical protein
MAFSSVEIYSACDPLAINCVLYTNYGLSTTAQAGFYRVGDSVYQANASGVVTAVFSCSNAALFIGVSLAGSLSEQVRFRSLINCSGGSGTLVTTGCQIDIEYSYTDANFTSGTTTATITAGANQVFSTPTGEPITSYQVVSATFNGGSCAGYSSSITACYT